MGKQILVTGGAGHVGSHVVEQLLEDPSNYVVSLDNYTTGKIENHIEGAEYRPGYTENINKIINFSPDIVYHLGEYARIATSFADAKKVFQSNIVGTMAVAQFCRDRSSKLVYAASSTKFAIEGDGRLQSPYAHSKASNVDLINGYGRWFDLDYAICYFYNAFGPRENGEGKYATLIEKFHQQHLAGKPLTVVKPGTQKRNFTYVGDLARGIILAGEKGHGDGYALQNEKGFSILDIANAFGDPIIEIEGYPGRAESGESPTKARDELGWSTTVDVLDYIEGLKLGR